ncbi:MAG TPA: hypothetical protein DCY89_00750, partial [Gammaproteobacteria bacterium]|nr:hypothetical protein [Gammaproteobacteria bacterium]
MGLVGASRAIAAIHAMLRDMNPQHPRIANRSLALLVASACGIAHGLEPVEAGQDAAPAPAASPAIHNTKPSAIPSSNALPEPRYVEGERHPGGTGRYYFGREIAEFMSHHGAEWLERAEREREEAPSRLHEWLAVPHGAVVADVGAGTGYHSRRLAAAVGPMGRVLAVDLQPEMLERLRERAQATGMHNIEPILGSATDPGLKDGCCELILLVDVYHELAQPHEVTRRLVEALKPGGRLVIVEYRGEDASLPIHALHTMTEAQLQLEMA